MIKKFIFLGIIFISFFIALNLINQITSAIKSGERLSEAADAVFKLEAKNRQLKQKLSEVQTDDFVESQARNKLGLAKKDEVVMIITEEKLKQILGASQSAKIRLPNWLGWWKVFNP